jgi:pimeloyl-ACP methyl ester carboxylesterase
VHASEQSLGLVQLISFDTDERTAPVVVCIPGAISNHKSYWSKNGKGLAPFLAKHGVNVFIGDRRGIGFSTPSLKDQAASGTITHGQLENIREDLPQIALAVAAVSGRTDGRQTWIAHSWGGVLLSAALAREQLALSGTVHVDSMVCFGTKKYIGEKRSWDYIKGFAWGWNIVCPLLAKIYGYLPAARFKIGSDDETGSFLSECTNWVESEFTWIDPRDGFDYLKAWNNLERRPPVWHISAAHDTYLGNPLDVKRWAALTAQTERFSVLEGYDHNSMLISPKAVTEHFPQVLEWIRRYANGTETDKQTKQPTTAEVRRG